MSESAMTKHLVDAIESNKGLSGSGTADGWYSLHRDLELSRRLDHLEHCRKQVMDELALHVQHFDAIESQLSAMQQPTDHVVEAADMVPPSPASPSLAEELADSILKLDTPPSEHAANQYEQREYQRGFRVGLAGAIRIMRERLSQLPNAEQIARQAKIEALEWCYGLNHRKCRDEIRDEISRLKSSSPPAPAKPEPPVVKADGLREQAVAFLKKGWRGEYYTYESIKDFADFAKSELLRQLDELTEKIGPAFGSPIYCVLAQARKELEAE